MARDVGTGCASNQLGAISGIIFFRSTHGPSASLLTFRFLLRTGSRTICPG